LGKSQAFNFGLGINTWLIFSLSPTAVNAYNTVLSVFFEVERNMFYRHKAAKMYTVRSILIAFLVAEIPFILLASMIFCVCFYFLVGFSLLAYKFFLYYLFFTLNLEHYFPGSGTRRCHGNNVFLSDISLTTSIQMMVSLS
jgi:hypothetical protein